MQPSQYQQKTESTPQPQPSSVSSSMCKPSSSTKVPPPTTTSSSFSSPTTSTNNDKKQYKASRIQTRGNKTVYYYDKRISFEVDSHYKINQIIGRGVYGVVAQGENVNTGQKVAIKLVKQLFRDPGQAKRQLREIKILKFLKHKNIVSLLDIMKIQNSRTYNQVYLVLQFMQYNLRKLIHSKTPITQNMTKFILYQILNGLHHMHSADIIHRDLKPENILINQKLQLKIADMNLARKQDANPTQYVVTRPYRALQVFLCSKSYNKSIDIWSVGCIFAELIGRTVLFQGKDYVDQLKRFVAILGKPNIQHYEDIDPMMKEDFLKVMKQIPDRCKIQWKTLYPKANPQALDLLDHMLQYDTKARYTTEECMNHPFLRQLRQKQQNLNRCQRILDFSFDELPMQIEAIRKAIYDEAFSFHPDMVDEDVPVKRLSSIRANMQQSAPIIEQAQSKQQNQQSPELEDKQPRKMHKPI